VVAGDLPAIRDVISGPGVGVLVPVDDESALVEAVCAVLAAPQETFDQIQQRARAVARFDWTQCARAYGDLLAAQVPN
jgi:phosphatidylinositol alpha-mannosyltransferase